MSGVRGRTGNQCKTAEGHFEVFDGAMAIMKRTHRPPIYLDLQKKEISNGRQWDVVAQACPSNRIGNANAETVPRT